MALEELRSLIAERNLFRVEEYFRNGGAVNGVFKNRMTPLHYAIKLYYEKVDEMDRSSCNGRQRKRLKVDHKNRVGNEIILRLIRAGADLNDKENLEGNTPLFSALYSKISDKVIYELVNAGSDMNKECSLGCSPLMSALISKYSKKLIYYLVRMGADLNHSDNYGRTPLICAIKSLYDKSMIYYLIRKGALVNHKDNLGCTPLICAIESKFDDAVIDHLIQKGAHLNQANILGLTPLLYAIDRNYDKAMISYMIKKGADVNHADNYRRTAIWDALCRSDKYELCSTLISVGACANVFDRDLTSIVVKLDCCKNKNYRRESICNVESCQNKAIIDLFVTNGVDLKSQDKSGNSIIHLVNCNYLISLCIKSGVSVDSKNKSGKTPLLNAVINNDVAKTRKLLDLFGADVNCADSQFKTPLHYAHYGDDCSYNSDKCLPLILLYHGANLYAKDLKNITPLDLVLRICLSGSEWVRHVDYTAFDEHFKPWGTTYLCDMPALPHFLLFVDENGLNDYYKNVRQNFIFNDFVYPWIEKCKEELNNMKSTFIKPGMSFYQFCLLKKFYKSRYINLSTEEYDNSYEKIYQLFPSYRHIIMIRLNDNRRKKFKRVLLNSLENIIIKPLSVSEKDSDVQLIFDCKYYIGRYLDRKHIYNLFQASIDQ